MNRENAVNIRTILDANCKASGQNANLDKSCIFFSPNTSKEEKEDIAEELGIGAFEHLGKYLGLSVI